ncbi:MAG: hypothetical protein COV10_01155 [Candidatus Vogelbacteria bacterium CG10_big_fil_rev_8_21_14_0_10_51_16]|uniref:CARDB domain-containing protein n=1 Tax=Candidatus Vogelbacteria bacterium CG10_big_fil_rev_8_21_14_0_10_51_16 TaxID=1975045 RepID=A0A2H0RH69_9BACT|nr:MAG: hypothetical protein COV10_01155 [Candidatus Vogelbacteria bacterium CG10_big_fil_rev_8_21_14_0_10_51_16]
MYRLATLALFVVLTSFATPLLLAAQETRALAMLEPVNCFDYYKFGSVQVDVSAPTATVASGTSVAFSGELKNANSYPVVEGAVYVKIYREQEDTSATQRNGHYLVDQFFAKENISVAASSTQPISFTWEVPAAAPSGNYMAAMFFVSDRKFNLLGLTFTDDILGNRASFRVRGDTDQTIHFEKNAVTVQGKPYLFAAFTPKLDARESIVVQVPLVNKTGSDQTPYVRWELYSWDALRPENLLETKELLVDVPAQESRSVQYVVEDTGHAVYLLVGTVEYKDTKSIIGVRFTREGISSPRLNYPAVADFPLTSGEPTTLFSCIHGAGTVDTLVGNKLTLTLRDKRDKLIHVAEYSGNVTGAMMGFASKFTPTKTYDRFTLTAEIRQGERLIERSVLRYDCKEIDPDSCRNTAWRYLVTALVLMVALGTVRWWRQRRKTTLLQP